MTNKNYINRIKKTCAYLFLIIFTSQIYFSNVSAQTKDTMRYRSNPNYQIQSEMFDLYKTRRAEIVMFGNSLTHGANWEELLNRNGVVERGIPGDILQGFYARLNTVIKLNPKIVFIMGGVNDIYGWIPVEEIFASYVKILDELRAKNIVPVVQSTTYTTRDYAKEWGGTPEVNSGRNREIDRLNKLLHEYCKKNQIEYLDLIPLISKDGFLKADLTWDGVHFKANAYKIWAKEVDKVLQKLKF